MQLSFSLLKQIIAKTTPPEPPTDMYQPTCVFLLVYDKKGESHILFIQKSDNEGYPWRNQVALPGGHVDKSDASSKAAAFRELKEEVCIPEEQVAFIGSIGHFQTINHKDIEVFTGLWNGEGPLCHDPSEIARVLEVPLEALVRIHRRKDFHGRIPDLYDLTYPLEDAVIWGATARILHYFIELLIDNEA
jgi:8-oxo-dGTP pyrophosphatase MutT (NUDIX family)